MTTTTTRPNLDSDEMPGTRSNPMPPGSTLAEINEARRLWAERDPLTQEQRNELAAAGDPTGDD